MNLSNFSLDKLIPVARRRLLVNAISVAAFGALAGAAQAQPATAEAPYPNRAIKFIVPLAPGGVADVMSRMVAEHLQNKWGQPVVVENRPGAGTSIGMSAVAKAKPDGYTIGMGNIAANAIFPALQPLTVPYHPINDFAPISLVGVTPSMLVVNADKIAAKTLPELVAYLKANPGKVSYGSSGTGTSLHIGMELFMIKTGTNMVHVPYKGSAPMLNDLLAGQIDVALDAQSTSGPHIQSGKLRALGVTTATRAFFAPNLPSISEFVSGYEVKAWHGVMAPAGTPDKIIATLSAEIQAFLRQPETEAKLRDRGVIRVGSGAKDFAKVIADDIELYKSVIKTAGIKAE
ncbi:MAG TPA: tripartite tricarboxylate transporter substrate binding protein [Polaromonas sp.]|uniref:Bug family tripartite tricarboxylate transporter substrate binding protein n=1 Tax=Polaromonas sp. TaxID=1869339 RepID=UPI002D4CA6EA|nr:tripartite tricarboxylate transporter substrate binding protein [Polaromonas sp.]HYW55573.1 tripartite tricarboxylate transporter substrate binding protein [Polaromonas sp.]